MFCVVVFPALLLAINVGWACGHSGWGGLRLSPLARVLPWLASTLGHAPANGVANGLEKPLGFGRMIWIFIPTMTRGLSPVFALLMFGGMWGWHRVLAHRDHQALFCTAIVIMCGIWVQLWYDRNICPRYALAIVLMASPFAALGLLGLIARLLRIAGWLQWGIRPQQTVVAVVAATVAIISLGDAMTSNGKYFETRQMAADLGRWVRNQYPSPPAIVGPVGITPIISFYAHNAPYRPSVGKPTTHRFWRSSTKAALGRVAAAGEGTDRRAMRRIGRPSERLWAPAGGSRRPAHDMRRTFRSGACRPKPAHRTGTLAGILRAFRVRVSPLSLWERVRGGAKR